jgi:hypothetical protein
MLYARNNGTAMLHRRRKLKFTWLLSVFWYMFCVALQRQKGFGALYVSCLKPVSIPCITKIFVDVVLGHICVYNKMRWRWRDIGGPHAARGPCDTDSASHGKTYVQRVVVALDLCNSYTFTTGAQRSGFGFSGLWPFVLGLLLPTFRTNVLPSP